MEPLDKEATHQSIPTDLTDTLAAYVALVNREGLIEFAGHCEGGLTPDRLVGQKIFDRIPHDARQVLADKLGDVFQTNDIEIIRMPAPAQCNNGGSIEIRLVPLVESGKPLQTVAVSFRRTVDNIQDSNRLGDSALPISKVTTEDLPCERSLKERQFIESMLRQSEESSRHMAEASPQGILIIQDGWIVFANQKSAQLLGVPIETLVGRQLEDVIRMHTGPDLHGSLDETHGNGEESTYAVKIQNANSGTRWIEFSSVPVTFNNRDSRQVALTDITARKKTEEALRDSEERYRTLVESAPNAILTMQRDGTLVFMNSVAGRMLGGEAIDFVGKNVKDLFPADKAARHLAAVQRVIDSGKGETIENLTELQGQPRWHITCIQPLNDQDGRRRSAFLISTDITERKHSEQLLRRSQEAFRDLVENVDDVLYTTDRDLVITYVSPVVESVLGYDPSELIGLPALSLVLEEDLPMIQRAVQDVLNGRLHPSEYRMIAKDGDTRWVRSLSRPVYEGDVFAGVRGVLADIHERKLVEEALLESEKRYRELFEKESDAIMVFDAETHRFEDANDATLELYGYSREEFLTLTAEDISAEPDQTLAIINRIVAGNVGPMMVPLRYQKKKDGTIFPVEISPGVFSVGGRRKIIGAVRDITERKVAEQAIRESEERFRALYKGSPLPTYTWRWNGDDFVLIDHNEAALKITEGGILKYLGSTVNELYKNQPDYLQDIQSCYENRATINREVKYTYQSVAKTLDLAVRYTYVPPDLVLVVTEDITQRKLDEEALRASEERFRVLIENQDEGIAIVDLNEVFQFANPAANRILGAPTGELVGRNLCEFVSPEDWQVILDQSLHRQEGLSTTYELSIVRPDGIRRRLLVTGTPQSGSDGTVSGTFGVFRDITDTKEMEEALRSTNELLAKERRSLLEKNIALKVILHQSKDEADQVKQNVQSNIDKLVLPILVKLKEKSRDSDRIDLELLESLISDVASPFLRDLETKFAQLTPRETEICNMIKNGLQSKEIGMTLGISVRTVEKFRQKIRDKLGVDCRETNLTTYLRSITAKR